jgi:hypothetical protein
MLLTIAGSAVSPISSRRLSSREKDGDAGQDQTDQDRGDPVQARFVERVTQGDARPVVPGVRVRYFEAPAP